MKSAFSRRLSTLQEEAKYQHKMNQDDVIADIKRKLGEKIAQSSYSAYLNDTKVPSHLVVKAFCNYFGVSYEWLQGEVDDRRTVKELLQTIGSIGDQETQRAAQALALLPDTERRAMIANIHAAVKEHEKQKRNDERWKLLAETIGLMDNDGRLKAFVENELGGIEDRSNGSSIESVRELVNQPLLNNTD